MHSLTAMVQTPSKALTLDEFLKLPETQPASEFVEGRIIQKPIPQGKHSTVQLDLGADINQYWAHALTLQSVSPAIGNDSDQLTLLPPES